MGTSLATLYQSPEFRFAEFGSGNNLKRYRR